MSIKMPMDPELYEAAEKVMEVIEAKLQAERHRSAEAVLGHPLALAYGRWHDLLVSKYVNSPPPPAPPVMVPTKKIRPPQPASHPWKRRAVMPKKT
jgi:hypothetical protein